MHVLVSYDVSTETKGGKNRLRRVAQTCLNFGQRVQKSVFECAVNEVQYERLVHALLDCIEEEEDSLRIYRLREPKEEFIQHFGRNEPIDFEGPLVI